MSDYLFPFKTCEARVDGPVAQPYSFVVNLVSTIVLLGFVCKASNNYVKIMLLTYAIFEAWHTYSHMKHLSGEYQKDVVHVLGYLLSITTLLAIYSLSKKKLSSMPILTMILLLCVVMFDIYAVIEMKGIYSLLSGLMILVVVIITHLHLFPSSFKRLTKWLFPGIILLGILLVNESYQCEKMMSFKQLPYHVLVEVVGLALFVMLGYGFLRWDRKTK